ncbi:MAG: patatin-like phospholipase family protein [Burkholderiales bacterium]|nr:patatin-like phospholipase family protein [Burkholderiales bacterium]
MKRAILFFILVLLYGCATVAPPPQAKPAVHHRIALVLGGGAARGFAHIGVIKALESQGIHPDIVVGTSAGAVVGALYASGYSGFDLQKAALDMDEGKVGDWAFSERGFIKGELLQNFVNKAVKNRAMEKLEKPFAAVATDLQTGEMVIFRTGNTGMAVRASSSVPGVFQPVPINGRDYVDGGLVSPVPVRAARSMGADIVIAVDISSRPRFAKVSDAMDILLQTFTIMEQSITRFETNDADIVIKPAIGNIGATDFEDRHLAIMEGEKAGLAAIPLIRKKLAGN